MYKTIERAMGMSDAVWRRHANPWSGWTRVWLGLPLITLAIWSRVWIGGWAWLCLAAVALWIWLNPRIFPVPARSDAWMTRGVLGEYLFLNHRDRVAAHHIRAAHVLSWLSLPGFLLLVWGLWRLDPLATVTGVLLTALPKMWFIDRMVWIHADAAREGITVLGFDEEAT